MAVQRPSPARSAEVAGATAAPPGPIREFWYYFRENKGAVAGLVVLMVVLLSAIFADFVAPHAPAQQYRDHFLAPPAWEEGGSIEFLLGTDAVGRDILSRIIFGARYSLFIALIVVTISLTFGISIGLVAGFARGWTEAMIMRMMDILLAVPSLLLAIVIVAILGPGLFNAVVAIAVTYLPQFVRLTRASVITETSKDYVTASRVAGAGLPRLMFSTVLPNCMAPLIVQASLAFSAAILDAAALGFLGLGAQPPEPEWGFMLSSSRDLISRAPWMMIFPGSAIAITVLGFNLLGDGIREVLDPRQVTR